MNTSKPRRIIIFSLVYYPRFVGGAEVAVKEITDRVSSNEIMFDMVTLNGGAEKSEEKIGNVNIHRIFNSVGPIQKLLFPFAAFLKAQKLNRNTRYDATWSIMANYAGFAALFFKLAHSKVPFLLTLQEGDPIAYIKRRVMFVYPLFKMIFTRATYIQAISTYLAQWAKDMNAKCPIDVVPNAVDWKLFSTKVSESATQSLKEKLDKKSDDIFIITTSRLVAKNAVGDVIQALQYLPVNVKFLILGQGPQEAELKAQAAAFEVADRVNFLGYVPHKDMPQYLHVSDMFIRPSISEGLGNSFLEAMAAGIPVIATPVGGIPDFLIDGETGLFCEVKNPKSIAQKVEKIIRDKESRDYIVEQARMMVEKKYQWEYVTTKMKEIFASL